MVPPWLIGVEFCPRWTGDPGRLACECLQTDHLSTNEGSASVVRFEIAPGGSFRKAAEFQLVPEMRRAA